MSQVRRLAVSGLGSGEAGGVRVVVDLRAAGFSGGFVSSGPLTASPTFEARNRSACLSQFVKEHCDCRINTFPSGVRWLKISPSNLVSCVTDTSPLVSVPFPFLPMNRPSFKSLQFTDT